MTVYRVDIQITTPVMQTEVTDRVREAVTNLFPSADLTHRHGELIGEAHALEHFSDRLHEQAILDSARAAFFANREGDTFDFALKKQAAYEGVVNFSVGASGELGDITVRVRVHEPDLEAFIDHIAPPTEDGKPIQPE